MSQQINLLNPALRKPFDWLSAAPLAIAAGTLLGLLVTATAFAKLQTDSRQKSADQLEAKVKTAQEQLTTLAKSVAENKPSPQLAAELANVQALIKSRQDLLKLLDGGGLGNTTGFAGYLSGLARQVPTGLWLRSVAIGAGGAGMEIHGRMVSPSALPDYIRRLSSEKAFKGHSFASLSISRPEEGKERKQAAGQLAATGSSPAAAGARPQAGFVDFVLRPSTQGATPAPTIDTAQKADASQKADATPAPAPAEEKKS